MADRRRSVAAGPARLEIDLAAGARLASLQLWGEEILVTAAPSPIDWGCYPMAPFAGRVRQGRFRFGGKTYELPRNLGPHAIHGTVFDRRWTAVDDTTFTVDLGPEWPFPGHAVQTIVLHPHHLDLRLEVHTAGPAFPASAGWHPWFRRHVAGAEARLDFHPGFMLQREPDGVAGRTAVPPPPGPWDDCFGGVETPPRLYWPGFASITISSSADFWVVYDEPSHAVCVEPQTHPPHALGRDAAIVTPDTPLVITARIDWRRHEG